LKGLLWAILLVLIGIAFPIAWVIILPLLVLLLIGSVLKAIFTPAKHYSKQNTFTQKFKTSEGDLFKLLVKTISSMGYQIKNADKDSGLIIFNTGASMSTFSGQEASVVVAPMGTDTCDVQINIGYKAQLWDWGEGKKIVDKIFNELKETVPYIDDGDTEDEGVGKEAEGQGIFKTWWNANKGIKN